MVTETARFRKFFVVHEPTSYFYKNNYDPHVINIFLKKSITNEMHLVEKRKSLSYKIQLKIINKKNKKTK